MNKDIAIDPQAVEETIDYEPLPHEQRKFYEDMEYLCVGRFRGQIVGLRQFLFTVGIVVGLDETGYSHRFCYDNMATAYVALIDWIVSGGDEPKEYIKRKPEIHH